MIAQVTSRPAAAQYLRDLGGRERAMALLRRNDLSVTEVRFAVGRSSPAPSAVA